MLPGCGKWSNDRLGNRDNRASSVPVSAAACGINHTLSGTAESAAYSAIARKDYRLYRYPISGEGELEEVAGFEMCHGRALQISGQLPSPATYSEELHQRDTIWLEIPRDTPRKDTCIPCDPPANKCGEARVAWAAQYNRVIVGSGHRGAAPKCDARLAAERESKAHGVRFAPWNSPD